MPELCGIVRRKGPLKLNGVVHNLFHRVDLRCGLVKHSYERILASPFGSGVKYSVIEVDPTARSVLRVGPHASLLLLRTGKEAANVRRVDALQAKEVPPSLYRLTEPPGYRLRLPLKNALDHLTPIFTLCWIIDVAYVRTPEPPRFDDALESSGGRVV